MFRIKRQPLAVSVADELKREISAGNWQEILPSEHKLSSEIGVSRTTLRRALSLLVNDGWIRIHQGSQTQILRTSEQVAEKKKVHTGNIGVLTPCPLSELKHYALFWIDELRSILHEHGFGLHMQHGKVYYREHTGRALGDLVKSQPADCWVLAFSSPHIQNWFQEQGIPTIVQGHPATGVDLPFVATDNGAVMFHAIGRLTGKGHRSIALLSENTSSPGLEAFEHSFLETCSKQANRGVKGSIIKLRDTDATTAKNAILMTLKQGHPPTAFIVVNPLHCLTATTSLPRRGYRIPEDISLITTFGDPSLEFLNPAPAHYSYPYQQIAKKIADLALKMASGTGMAHRENYIMPKPVKGQSIGSPKQSSAVA